jgi:hypothetical protein
VTYSSIFGVLEWLLKRAGLRIVTLYQRVARVWGTRGRLEIANGSVEAGGPDCLLPSPAPRGGGKEVRAILPLDVFLIYQAKRKPR